MKRISLIIVVLLLTGQSFATDLDITIKVKRNLCGRLQRYIPTDSGHTISIKDCIGGQFTQSAERGDRYIIEWIGQTVEDMATVCEAEWAKEKEDIRKLNTPNCDLQ